MRLIPLLISFAVPVASLGSQHPEQASSAPLTATVLVKETSGCIVDDAMTRLTVKAEFRVKNDNTVPLILMRGAPLLYYWRTSTTLESIASQDWSHLSYYGPDKWGHPRQLGPRPDRRFVIITNERHHAESVEWSFFVIERLPEGGLWAQVVASPTDDWDPKVEEKTIAAWRPYGRLWVRGIRSQPFRIVLNGRGLSRCEQRSPRE